MRSAHKKRPKEPSVPEERDATLRRQILSALESGTWSARELSVKIGLSEKEVAGHLEHIRRSTHGKGRRLTVLPAECRTCGYAFSNRQRLSKPGKCPVCKGETIHPPAFTLTQGG